MKLDPEREERLRAMLRDTEKMAREPGMLQWIEMLDERVQGSGVDQWRRWHQRIYDLLTEVGDDLGVKITRVPEAQVLAALLIGPGFDDGGGDGECEPTPVPDGERVAV